MLSRNASQTDTMTLLPHAYDVTETLYFRSSATRTRRLKLLDDETGAFSAKSPTSNADTTFKVKDLTGAEFGLIVSRHVTRRFSVAASTLSGPLALSIIPSLECTAIAQRTLEEESFFRITCRDGSVGGTVARGLTFALLSLRPSCRTLEIPYVGCVSVDDRVSFAVRHVEGGITG
ncbi:hypothetical protein BaRGS_00021155 [Batillaria attramentaria]|uniref:Uncharacterized protein n=1 Tax=Batillaria attramentaria TaxID=370345 RepID=A0ABD0KKA1_9CAEN